jgi:hypothetical protein
MPDQAASKFADDNLPRHETVLRQLMRRHPGIYTLPVSFKARQ